jgi:hypothetical protein
MHKLARSRKGSSLVLASMLLVIVTVAAGVLFYNTIMGSVSSMTNNFNTQMSLLLLEGSKINATCITAFLRNTGQFSVDVVNAYVNNEVALLAQAIKLASNALGTAYVEGTYTEGSTYSVKLATVFGVAVTFDVKY